MRLPVPALVVDRSDVVLAGDHARVLVGRAEARGIAQWDPPDSFAFRELNRGGDRRWI